MIGVWVCGNGHRFTFGDEDWHSEVTQGRMSDEDENVLIPMYCTERYSNGEPCSDSSSLILDEVIDG